MKYFLLLFFSCACLLAYSQQTLSPEILSYPDISKAAIEVYQQKLKRYQTISKQIETAGKETISQEAYQFWLENEFLETAENPFITEEVGCSWYCAGGPAEIKASESLEGQGNNSYEASLSHDFNLKTAWAVHNEKGGIGESIHFRFEPSENLSLTTIEVYNGYSKSSKSWRANSRAKKILVSLNDKPKFIFELEDTSFAQRFNIGEVFYPDGLLITFSILEVYPGASYQDLCISEINFDGKGDH